MIKREEILAMANSLTNNYSVVHHVFDRQALEQFFALAYAAGQRDMQERAAKVCGMCDGDAACQADAARYRYLRHASRRECLDRNGPEAGCWIDCEDENHTLILLTEEDADNAIDAAMAKVEDA